MKHLKKSAHWTLQILLFSTLSFNLNAQFEINNDNGDGGELDITKFGTSFIELRPPGTTLNTTGSTLTMYKSLGNPRTQTIKLDAGTSGNYGSLALEAIVNLPPFGDANTTGISSATHPYRMIRLTKKGTTTQQPNYAWSIGVYDNFEYAGDADGPPSTTDDCINCLTMAYETGGAAAFYKYSFGSDGDFEAASDARLKKNITDVKPSLSKILELSSKNYHYIWSEENPKNINTGFLAQDVQKVFPELVSSIQQPNGERTLMLNYIGMIPYITKGMQEQQDIISNQDEKISELHTMITHLSAQVKVLQEGAKK